MANGRRTKKAPRVRPKTPPAAKESKASRLLTRRELAAALSEGRDVPVHMMTVTKWERDGMPCAERGGPGKPSRYRLDDIQTWLAARQETQKPTGTVFDVARARASKDEAQAALARQTFEMRQRELLPRAEVERVWAAEVLAVRTKIISIPASYTDQVTRVAALEGFVGVERVLEEMVRDVLTELANPDRHDALDEEAKTA